MENPWLNLPQTPPYLLAADQSTILLHNKRVEEKFQIRYDALPDPYLGNPDAPIILLSLNPGFKESDLAFYAKPYVRDLWQTNILHQPATHPFFLLHPSLAHEGGGNHWWRRKLKSLIEYSEIGRVTNKLCCIEFLPYHSLRYKHFKQLLPSQLYGFHLVRRAIHNKAVIVIMRSEKLWTKAVPELATYPQLYRLNNPQNPTISLRNCPIGFSIIQRILNA